MKAFGYAETPETDTPLTLTEVTIAASAEELRKISEFLLHVASQMEEHGEKFGHEHFGDYSGEKSEVQLIAVGPL